MMPDREKAIRGLICCQIQDCLKCPYAKLDQCMTLVVNDALALLKEQEALTAGVWHKWPDEKPEDYVDSTIPDGKGCWEITCLSLSRNGRTYLQKRTRFINWDTENCHWSHWPDHGSAGWWMFIPEPPKEDDDAKVC